MKRFRVSSRKTTCVLIATALAAAPACDRGGAGFLGLQDFERDLLFGVGSLAIQLLRQPVPGPQGPAGPQGPQGAPGQDGSGAGQGAPGQPGADGLVCWDLNGNGINDPDEDRNGDGEFSTLDCAGTPGAPGPNGSGGGGSPGPQGPAGEPGPLFISQYIDDFFTADVDPTGELPVNIVSIVEPRTPEDDPIGYRVNVPQLYTPGNQLNMRLFLYRTGPIDGCQVLRIDAARLRDGSPAETYGDPRFVRLNLSNGVPAEGGILVLVDLPLNSNVFGGLNFPNDLIPGQFLAFELNTAVSDGGSYMMLGVEFYEAPINTTPAYPHQVSSQIPEECDTPRCTTGPTDLVIMLDRTGSVFRDGFSAGEAAAVKGFLESLAATNGDHRVAIARFGDSVPNGVEAEVVQPLADLSAHLASLQASVDTALLNESNVGSNLRDAIDVAQSALDFNGRPDVRKMIILISDGVPNEPLSGGGPEGAALTSATAAKKTGTEIVTIALGSSGCEVGPPPNLKNLEDADEAGRQLLAAIATNSAVDNLCADANVTQMEIDDENTDGDYFFISQTGETLTMIFAKIFNEQLTSCPDSNDPCTAYECIDGFCVQVPLTSDMDGDGVPDCRDECADTGAGIEVDEFGCSCVQLETCPACGDDIVLMLDRTETTRFGERSRLIAGAQLLVDDLAGPGLGHQIGVGRFGDDVDGGTEAEITAGLSDAEANTQAIKDNIATALGSDSLVGSNLSDAILVGMNELLNGVNARSGVRKILVLAVDGYPNEPIVDQLEGGGGDFPAGQAMTAADMAKQAGIIVYTVATDAVRDCASDADLDSAIRALLAAIATNSFDDQATCEQAVSLEEAQAENSDGDAFFISREGEPSAPTNLTNVMRLIGLDIQATAECTPTQDGPTPNLIEQEILVD